MNNAVKLEYCNPTNNFLDVITVSRVLVRVSHAMKQGGCRMASLTHGKQYLVDSESLQDAIHMLRNAVRMLREIYGHPGGHVLQTLRPLLHGGPDI